MSAVATDTIWRGETSMKSTSAGIFSSGSPKSPRGAHHAAQDLRIEELARLRVERLVGLGDDVPLLLIGGEVVDLVGDLALRDLAVRRLDEAVRVDARKRRERADEADVRAFRRLDRAHAAVVARVHVADFEACALARQAAGSQRRQTALVSQAGDRVGLVHELRQLARTEELLDGGDDWPDVDERLRGDLVDVLRGHALSHHALHAREADPELVLDQLAHRADAAIAEVVDVVDVGLVAALPQLHKVGDRSLDVFRGERRLLVRQVQAQLLVDLVATDLGEVVTLRVEEQPVEQRAGGLDRRRLAGTQDACRSR